jgi:hypothetical protein
MFMYESVFPGEGERMELRGLKWIRDDQLRGTREQAGSVESILYDGWKGKVSRMQQLFNCIAHCFMFRVPAGLQGFSDTIIF